MHSLREAILLPSAADTSHSYLQNEQKNRPAAINVSEPHIASLRPGASRHTVQKWEAGELQESAGSKGWEPCRAASPPDAAQVQAGWLTPVTIPARAAFWGFASTHSQVSGKISQPRVNTNLLGKTLYLNCSQAIRNPCPSVERLMEILSEFYGETFFFFFF